MKNIFRFSVISVFICTLLVFTSCSSTKVERVDTDTITDLSGYWNDTDVRIVADSLIADCVNAPAITNYVRTNGK